MTREDVRALALAEADKARNGLGGLIWRRLTTEEQNFVLAGQQIWTDATDANVNGTLDRFASVMSDMRGSEPSPAPLSPEQKAAMLSLVRTELELNIRWLQNLEAQLSS